MFSLDDETRRTIVRPHIHDTCCYLLSAHAPCTQTAKQQQAANRMRTSPTPVGRDIVLIDYQAAATLTPPKSWLLVALLCEGDDIAPLVSWVKADVRRRLDRVRFYRHESTQPEPLLRPWVNADLPPPRIDTFSDQRGLSARFGQDILLQIAEDWGPNPRRPPV